MLLYLATHRQGRWTHATWGATHKSTIQPKTRSYTKAAGKGVEQGPSK